MKVSAVFLPPTDPAALERARRSMLAQSLPDWSLVAETPPDGDQASNSRLLADERIVAAPALPAATLGGRLNRLLAHTPGEMVAFLDAGSEFYGEHFADIVRHAGRADVLIFAYDVAQAAADGGGWTHDPAAWRDNLFARDFVAPLGIVFRRAWHAKVGGFNEQLWTGVLWDFLKRLVRAGAAIAFLPLRSGRHIVGDEYFGGSKKRAEHRRNG
jgi:hypothetical protein